MKKISEKSIKALERLESSYKLIYTIIMSAPLIVALEVLLLQQDPITGVLRFKDLSLFSGQDILLFVLFLFFYVGFFLGDIRYLDVKYLEGQRDTNYLERYSPFSRFIDLFSLIVHAVFFYLLAVCISNFEYFYLGILAILIINAVWLSFVYLTSDPGDRKRIEVKSTITWAINNYITFGVLTFLLMFGSDLNYLSVLFTLIMAVNIFMGFALCWKLYFPRIREEIED